MEKEEIVDLIKEIDKARKQNKEDFTEDEKKRAAYALNL